MLRPPIEPMRAAGVAELPEPRMCRGGCAYQPKFDGWRAIAFVGPDGVYLQSRSLKPLAAYFPDLCAHLAGLPAGTVLDGELISFDGAAGRTSFAALQRRVTVGRALAREVAVRPASFVCFDLLGDPDGDLLTEPLVRRRQRLETLLAGAPTALPVCPQTTDYEQAGRWFDELAATGVEGLVVKDLASRYRPGRPGWWKYKRRTTTEAIIGGVVGSLAEPAVLLLGRLDAAQGRLRYVGWTALLTVAQRREVATFARAADPDAAHPWPQPLPAAWIGQFDRREPVPYVPVQPLLVAEVVVDAAFDHGRWRHPVRHVRLRGDLTMDEVPRHEWTAP